MRIITFSVLAIAALIAAMAFNPQNMKSSGENKIIFFEGTFDEAVKASAEQKKPIFMDAYTSWCGWCKKLDRTTFSDKGVVEYLNTNFINLKVDMENGQGPSLGKKYRVSGYPTLLFIDSKGSVISRIGGYTTADGFIEQAQKVVLSFEK